IYGERAWKKYYGYKIEGDIPPLPLDIIEMRKKLCKLLQTLEPLPPCSLILMPKGLTLNKLRKMVENPIAGPKSQFGKVSDNAFLSWGEEPIEKSYWFFITNDAITIISFSCHPSINHPLFK